MIFSKHHRHVSRISWLAMFEDARGFGCCFPMIVMHLFHACWMRTSLPETRPRHDPPVPRKGVRQMRQLRQWEDPRKCILPLCNSVGDMLLFIFRCAQDIIFELDYR